MGGERCIEKGQANVDALIKRTERVFTEKGLSGYRDTNLEIIGSEATYGPHAKAQNSREVMVKLGLHHNSKHALQFVSREIAYLATSAAPGMSGFGAGRPKPQPLIRVHSALIDKALVPVVVQLNNDSIIEKCYLTPEHSEPAKASFYSAEYTDNDRLLEDECITVPLSKLVYARSGDKGNNLNIGIISRDAKFLPVLYHQVTATAVQDYFSHQVEGEVERFNVPGMNAFNFLMTQALGGGGTASLRIDSQGKAAAQMLLSMQVKIPKSWIT